MGTHAPEGHRHPPGVKPQVTCPHPPQAPEGRRRRSGPENDGRHAIMANTYTNLLSHIVFSTKNRAAYLGDGIREPLYQYVGGVIRGEGGTLLEIGGVADHIHLGSIQSRGRGGHGGAANQDGISGIEDRRRGGGDGRLSRSVHRRRP